MPFKKMQMDSEQLRQIVESMEEDEQRELCDQRMQGKKSAVEVDVALAQASPRLKELRRHSEPLRNAFKQKLVEQLLAPPTAIAPLPAVSAGEQPIPIKQEPRRPRSRMALYAGGTMFAAAAAFAVVAAPILSRPALPQFSLKLTPHTSQLLGATESEPGTGVLTVKSGGCIKLELRPRKVYDQDLQTQVLLFQDPVRPLQWPVALDRSENGVLRQPGPCAQLPTEAGPGYWTLVVTYGRALPAPRIATGVAAAGEATGPDWKYLTQSLQVEAAAPATP